MLDLLVKNSLKYLLQGLAVAVAAKYIPSRNVSLNEVLMIALTAAVTFFVLDMFAPTVGAGARFGAGFGIGGNMVGMNVGAEGMCGSCGGGEEH